MLGGAVQNIWALLVLLSAKKSHSFTNILRIQGRASSSTGYRPHFAVNGETGIGSKTEIGSVRGVDTFRILPLDLIENLLDLEDPHDDNHSHIGDDDEAPLQIKTKRSLYEILKAPKNATKAELKIQYIAMARETHPDALIGRGMDTTAAFSEVAEAWKILSNAKDRRRYDRSLQTDELSDALAEKAVPTVLNMFGKVAAPFLRRTAVTAVASFSAAAQDIIKANGTKIDFGHALSMGMKAGGAAGRIVDELELLEKAKELETRTLEEAERLLEANVNGTEEFVSQGSASSTRLLVETERSSANQTKQMEAIERASVLNTKQVNKTESTSEVQAKQTEAIQAKQVRATERASVTKAKQVKGTERASEVQEIQVKATERASVTKAKQVKATERSSEVQATQLKATERVLAAKTQLLKEAERASEVQAKQVKATERASKVPAKQVNATERASKVKVKQGKETEQTSAVEAKQVQASDKKVDETTKNGTISTAAKIATTLGGKRKEMARMTTQSNVILTNETIAALVTTIRALERAEAFHEQVNADPEIETIADLEELKRVLQGKRGAAYNLFARKKISAPSIIESIGLLEDMKHTLEEAESFDEQIMATSIIETISVLEEMKRALEVETERAEEFDQKLNATSKELTVEKVPRRLEGIGDYLKSRRPYKKKSEL